MFASLDIVDLIDKKIVAQCEEVDSGWWVVVSEL
jgi:hypothetical protein